MQSFCHLIISKNFRNINFLLFKEKHTIFKVIIYDIITNKDFDYLIQMNIISCKFYNAAYPLQHLLKKSSSIWNLLKKFVTFLDNFRVYRIRKGLDITRRMIIVLEGNLFYHNSLSKEFTSHDTNDNDFRLSIKNKKGNSCLQNHRKV